MENRSFYNEILTEHNIHPEFKHDLPDANIELEGVNPSCGDDITLKLKVDGDVITDGAFIGDGCAISQASADIMLGMIVGRKKEEALRLGEIFRKMIQAMENRSFYNEILTEHNIHPEFKHDLPDANIELEGVNPSCGDDITLKLKVDGDVITDGAFIGDGCAISQASADIMLGMIVGRKKEEALRLGEIFRKMIQGEATAEEIDELEEAGALKDISHMPARVKCAVLGWRTLKEAIGGEEE